MKKPELVVDSKCIIGEGPVWDSDTGKLYFIDILGRKMHCWNGREIEGTIEFDQSLGFAVLRERGGVVGRPAGRLLLRGFRRRARPSGGQTREPGREDGRFNDGKVDPAGRVWGGTMPPASTPATGKPAPTVRCTAWMQDLQVKTMLTGVIQGNGLAWSADAKKFYFVDTQKFCVQEFDYDMEKNQLSNGASAWRSQRKRESRRPDHRR